MIRIFVWCVCLCLLALLAYVRLAPQDAVRWHQPVNAVRDADFDGGAVRVIDAENTDLARADAYMLALPRTRVLAGSVSEGRVTYVTRSNIFGFPDYTTIEWSNGQIKAYARLRFGRSDMGVNRKRLQGLIAALKTG